MCAELFVYFSKYISNMYLIIEPITLINASIILKKEEYEYSTFPNKVRHHKVQHRDQQRLIPSRNILMTEHDLATCSMEWLNRSLSSSGGAEKKLRPTLADVQEQYLPSVFAQSSDTPYITMLNGADWVCPVVRCSWKRGRMVEEETDPGYAE